VIETMPSAIVIADHQGRIVLVNQAAEKLFGYRREDLLGQPVQRLLPLPSAATETPGASLPASGGLLGRRKDGSQVSIAIEQHRIDAADEPLMLNVIVDIGQRTADAEARSRLAAIVSTADDAIVSKDLQGIITTWNAAAERLFGWPAAEAIGQHMRLYIPADRLADEERYLELLGSGQPVRSLETERLHRSGRRIPVWITISPICDAAGKVTGVSKIVRDITEKKRVEQELRQAHALLEQRVAERTQELEAANKELEAFSYSVSHDLRSPLRAIDGFSRILLEDYAAALPDEARDFLHDVRGSAQQMGRLVDDLLAFSRLSRQPLRRQRVEMNELVQQSLGELSRANSTDHVELRIGNLPPCSGDPALLKQVWVNLISNAIKYSRKVAQPVVEIASVPGEDSQTSYLVRDNGVGFDMRYAHKLFGVFQRLHRAEEFEGTGVGLAIVQRVVHRHGGRVWADAQPNLGATFFFTLPSDESTRDG
jgi:PAS domain S-box-containing protein